MNKKQFDYYLNVHKQKTSLISNIKLALNALGLISAIIYSWVSMENRISNLEAKILRMEEVAKLEDEIRMLELSGKEVKIDKLRKRYK